jgi:hypothetical protein
VIVGARLSSSQGKNGAERVVHLSYSRIGESAELADKAVIVDDTNLFAQRN